MSGARFARSGRFRLFAGFFFIILLIGILALYHSSSIQCETTIENIRRQAESQRYQLERVKEQETNSHFESQRNLEEQLKEQRQKHEKELLDARLKLEQLQQTHNILKNNHDNLVNECEKSKKQQLDDANSLEKKLQSLRSELKKSKTLQENEVTLWKEKYNTVLKEKSQLEGQTNKTNQEKRMKLLESIVAEFSSNCVYKPKTALTDLMQPQINNPLNPPETTHNVGKLGHLKLPIFDKPNNEKTFKVQESVSPGFYHIPIKVTNTTLKNNSMKDTNQTLKSNLPYGAGVVAGGVGIGNSGEKVQQKPPPLPFSAQNNRSLILNSVENFQIIPKQLKKLSDEETQETQLKQQPDNGPAAPGKVSPLSAPRKLTSTQSAKAAQRVLEQANNASSVSTSSSTSLPPLPLPPNPRKQLPAMVAPIPEFDQLLKEEAEKQQQQQQESPKKKAPAERDAVDIDAAIEDQGTNNRYANVVNDMDAKKSGKAVAQPAAAAENQNDDAREVKDNEALVNEPNFNLPADEDENNFFDAGDKNAVGDLRDGKHKNEDNDDDDDLGLGGGGADIAVKNHNLLEADNLNNEVAGDQGKEFPDGLRLEDANDEDEDEDEYANLAARQQGAQAIRN